MNKENKIDIFDLDLLLKGLYGFDLIESNGKKVVNIESDKNKRILSADGILCEYAYLYYISSRYNFAKDKEDTNTTVSREYRGYIIENKDMFAWLNNPALLNMCNEALKFRLEKPALIRGSLKSTLNGLDLIKAGKFNNKVDFSPIFADIGAKQEDKLPSVASALAKGSEFRIMSNLEDTKVKTDGYDPEHIALLQEMVDDEVTYILNVICGLYESGYQGFTPDGMLNKAGTISVVADSSVTNAEGKAQARYKIKEMTNTQLTKFYHWFSSQFPVFSLAKYNGNMRPNYNNVKNGISYYPHYQARNSCGLYGLDRSLDAYLTSNGKARIENAGALKSFLKERVTNIIMEGMVAKFGDALKKPADEDNIVVNPEAEELLHTYRRVLTTAVVVTECKRNVVAKLKISPGTREDAIKMTREFFEKAIKSNKIFNQATKITYYNMDESLNIVTITFMMDEKKYNGFPLFAFQAVEAIKRNGKPSWSNVVVGRTIEDKIFTLDLTPNTVRMVPIIAGSRSGKGVMTLNFLANAFALQYPVFYLDCKSEMGVTFYQLAKQRGVETFVYDGEHSSKAIPRDYDLLTGINKLPEKVKTALDNCKDFDRKEFALMTSYVRGMQLLDSLLTLRAMAFEGNPNVPYSVADLGGERIVLVWDEFEKFGLKVEKYMKKNGVLDSAQAELKTIFSDVKDAEVKKLPEWKWFDNYKRWLRGVFAAMSSHDKAQWSQARVTIFLLAQSVEIDQNWGEILSETMGTIIRNSLKVCGRGSDAGSGSSKYGSGKVSPEWKSKLNDRYFIIQRQAGGAVEQETSDLVKGYFLLDNLYDENGNEASCVNQLFSNLGANAAAVRQEVSIDGKLNPALAFDGYMQLLADGQDVFGPTLKKSWDIASLVSKHIYGYDNLNDYMYDVGNFSADGRVDEHVNEFELAQQKSDGEEGTPNRDLSSQNTVSADDLNQVYLDDDEEENGGNESGKSSETSNISNDPGYEEPPTHSIFGDLFNNMHIRTDLDDVNAGAKPNVKQGVQGQYGDDFDIEGDDEGIEINLDDPSSNIGGFGNTSVGADSTSAQAFNNFNNPNFGNEGFIDEFGDDDEIDIDIEDGDNGAVGGNVGNVGDVGVSGDIGNVGASGNTGYENSGLTAAQAFNNFNNPSNLGYENVGNVGNVGAETTTQAPHTNTQGNKIISFDDVVNMQRSSYNNGGANSLNAGASDIGSPSDLGGLGAAGVGAASGLGDVGSGVEVSPEPEVEHVVPTTSPNQVTPNLRDDFSVNNRQNVSGASGTGVNPNVTPPVQETEVSRAIKQLLKIRQQSYNNRNRAWYDVKNPVIVNCSNIIIQSEINNGCNLDYEDSDVQSKLLIIQNVLQAATKSQDVMLGNASGILMFNPNLVNTLATRTANLRARKEEQIRRHQAAAQAHIQNRQNNQANVQGNTQGNQGINLDNQARQYNEMQQRLQQQRAAQQAQQQALQQQRAAQQAQQQEQFSVNDYESSINFSNMGADQLAYQARTPKDNALKVNLRNIKAQVFGLTPQNSIDVSSTRNMSPFKRSTMLSRTAYGAKVYRQEGFKALLDTIDVQLMRSQIGNFNGVNVMIMRDDTIVVNNLVVDLNGVVGGITGRRLRDTVCFKELAKRYPRIALLEVDDDLLTTFCLEYKIRPVESEALFNKIFQIFPSLNTFRVGQYEITRNDIMLRAQDRRIAERQAKIAEKAQRKRNRSQFDAEMLSMTNARPSEDSELNGSYDYYNSSLMSPSEIKMRAKSITKGIAGFGLAATAFTVGALASGFSRGRNLFRRK